MPKHGPHDKFGCGGPLGPNHITVLQAIADFYRVWGGKHGVNAEISKFGVANYVELSEQLEEVIRACNETLQILDRGVTAEDEQRRDQDIINRTFPIA